MALLLVATAAVAADQVTKQLVARTLQLGDAVELAGPLSIHHVHNSGIAFGLFSSATSIVIALTAVAVICLVLFFARSGRRHPLPPVALGLVLGGSVSNLLDRIRLGYVTDFLDLAYWPSFQPRRLVHRRGRRVALPLVRGRRRTGPRQHAPARS